MTTTIERLEVILDEKDAEIESLEVKLRKTKERLEAARGGWSLPREVADDEPALPVPRLEFVYEPDPELGWKDYVARYQLVTRHLLGDLVGIQLGSTVIRSSLGEPPRRGELPFRDGAHAAHDAGLLGLDVFVRMPGARPHLVVELAERYTSQYAAGRAARRGA